jgi:hypothetical protein
VASAAQAREIASGKSRHHQTAEYLLHRIALRKKPWLGKNLICMGGKDALPLDAAMTLMFINGDKIAAKGRVDECQVKRLGHARLPCVALQ